MISQKSKKISKKSKEKISLSKLHNTFKEHFYKTRTYNARNSTRNLRKSPTGCPFTASFYFQQFFSFFSITQSITSAKMMFD